MSACPEVLTHLPTIISSHSDALDLKVFHTSMVKIVLELLKMEVKEDMRAAIITAIIKPRSPGRENQQRMTLERSMHARTVYVEQKAGQGTVSNLQAAGPSPVGHKQYLCSPLGFHKSVYRSQGLHTPHHLHKIIKTHLNAKHNISSQM